MKQQSSQSHSSHLSPEDYAPRPKKWLSHKIRYTGRGKAYFSGPIGALEGRATVSFNESGDGNIEMEVERLIIDDFEPAAVTMKSFRDFISNVDGPSDGLIIPMAAVNRCERIVIETAKGTFTADKLGNYIPSFPPQISVAPIASEFQAKKRNNSELYFAIPLLNFAPEPFSFTWLGSWQHPLRLYEFPEIPPALSEPEKMWLNHQFQSKRFLVFKFKDGKDAFIEPLPDYYRQREKLLKEKAPSLITSVLVGEVSSLIDYEPLLPLELSKVPNSLLSLLSLATGTRVGAPWIETRDAEGNLLRRIHRGLAASSFRRGLGILPITIPRAEGSIERLLTSALGSSEFNKLYVRAVISQIVLSGYQKSDGNIEDKMSFVFRGLEKLCDMRREEREPGKLEDSFISKEIASNVKQIIVSTIAELNQIKRNLGKRDPQKEAVGQIQGHIKRLLKPELGFGQLILDILEHNHLEDYRVLGPYYKTNPFGQKGKWLDSVVTYYRNDIFHRAWFDWDNLPPNFDELGAIFYHLRDVQIRLILMALNYDGHYQPNMRNVVDMQSQPVDWVKEDTNPRQLGY